MTNDIRLVVVKVSPTVKYNEVVEQYTARINELGITGYGDDAEKALSRVKDLYGSWVHAHRYNNDLEDCLKRSGIWWRWLDEYDGDREVEYVATPQHNPKKTGAVRRNASRVSNSDRELPLAA